MRKALLTLTLVAIASTLFLPVAFMHPTQNLPQRSQKVVINVENGEQIDLYQASYALIIGASDYTKGWKRLPGVKKDLEEIEKVLRKQGFEVEVLLNPTRSSFDERMRKFISKYGRLANNRLVIYFAGHGETLKTADGRKQGYLVPVDAPTPNKDEAGFKELAINMRLIENYATDIEAKHAMFVFDSCFSGTLFRGNEGRPPAMSSKAAKPVRQFITAGDENQTVPDESIFRQMFVRGLDGEADQDGDGYVTGSELGYFLETRVANYSNNSQTPRTGKMRNPDLDQGDLVFALPNTKLVGATKPKPKIEIEREVPLGTLIIIANRKDMEILLDKEVVAKSKAAGEKITIKNVEADRLIEVVGRVKGETDVVEEIELVPGGRKEVSLGESVVGSDLNENSTTNGSSTSLPSTATTNKKDVKIGTTLKLSMDTYLSSLTAKIGDPFTATVFEDVWISQEIAIARGTKVEGKVVSVNAAKRKKQSGMLGIGFDKLRLPNGQVISVEGHLASLNAIEQKQIDEENRTPSSSLTKRNVVFIGGGSASGAVIGAIGGSAITGALRGILSKGEEAQVMSGQKFGMEILRPITLADAKTNSTNPPSEGYRSRSVNLKSIGLLKRAQKSLLDLNYYKGPLNGVDGPSTRTAVRAFQRDYDLGQTGELDLDTAYQLGLVNEDGVEILPVRILSATADRQNNSIIVKAMVEASSGGWQIYTSTQTDGDQLHVYVTGAPPYDGRTQTLTRYPVNTPPVRDDSFITKVVIHGNGNPITVFLAKKL